MTQLINPRGGMKIDGLTFDCIAQSNIKAGQFVNFTNEIDIKFNDSISSEGNSGEFVNVCQLDDNHVFITHRYYSSDKSTGGALIKVENDAYTVLQDEIILGNYSCEFANCIAIDSTHVLVAFGSSNSQYLRCIVCTINGSTFTKSAEVEISTISGTGRYNQLFKLSDNRVLIIHSSNTRYKIAGTIVKVDGENITTLINTQVLLEDEQVSKYMTCTMVNENKLLIVHGTSTSNPSMNAFVVTIDGNTLTAGTDKVILTEKNTGMKVSSCKISENKVLVSYMHDGSVSTLGLLTLELNGDEIVIGANKEHPNQRVGSQTRLIPIRDKEALLLHVSDITDYHAMAIMVYVDEAQITFNDIEFSSARASGESMNGILLKNGKVLIVYRGAISSLTLSILLATLDKKALNMTTREVMYGVATQTKTQGQQIKVAIPKV